MTRIWRWIKGRWTSAGNFLRVKFWDSVKLILFGSLFCAFIFWNINPSDWHIIGRILLSIYVGVVLYYANNNV